MIRSMAYTCGFMAVCLAAASAAYAQESDNRVDAKTDWSIFVETDPAKECWVVSKPTKIVNTRGGKVVSAKRGDILFFVTYRPTNGVQGEVSFTGGYPFATDSQVSLEVGDKRYNMFVDGEWAWPATPGDDAKIRDSLKAGSNAVLTAQSQRGTKTKDTFSLSGFTAALAEAEKRCL